VRGEEIEEKSFSIIKKVLDCYALPEYGRFIVERIVHASADFSLAPLVVIREGFIEIFQETIRKKKYPVFCDVSMVYHGISPHLLAQSEIALWEIVNTPECWQLAITANSTRSEAAIELAVAQGIKGFVFGNSPTGLLRLVTKIKAGYPVDWVIGCPVGLVKAAEAKEKLLSLEIPTVVVRGAKGGSAIAASVINALLASTFRGEKDDFLF